MTEKKKPNLLKTFKGQLLVFLLLWSSCHTMSYYLATENYRKAKKIREHYISTEAVIEGIDSESFTFTNGETVNIKYNSEEKRMPTLFFSYQSIDNLSAESTIRNSYLKPANLSFNLDSTKIGSYFNVVYSSMSPDLIMDEGKYLHSLTDEHIKKIHSGLKSLAIVWLIVLSVLYFIFLIIYKINSGQILPTPEKDVRSFKVKFGLAPEPNDWDEEL